MSTLDPLVVVGIGIGVALCVVVTIVGLLVLLVRRAMKGDSESEHSNMDRDCDP